MDSSYLNIASITWDRYGGDRSDSWQHGACHNPFQGTLLASRIVDDRGEAAELLVTKVNDSAKRVLYHDPSAKMDDVTTRLQVYFGTGTSAGRLGFGPAHRPEDSASMYNIFEMDGDRSLPVEDLITKLGKAEIVDMWIAAYSGTENSTIFHVRHFNIEGSPDFADLKMKPR